MSYFVTGDGWCGRCDLEYHVAPGFGCPNIHTTSSPPDDWQKTSKNFKKWSLEHESEERKVIRVILNMVEEGWTRRVIANCIKSNLLKDPWE